MVAKSWSRLADLPAERVNQTQPCDLARLVVEVDQQFGEPRRVVPDVKPPDQRGAFGIGSLEHLEKLAGSRWAKCSDDSFPQVIHSRES
jgi:hypothetical protein